MIDPYSLELAFVHEASQGRKARRWCAATRLPWFRALPVSCVEQVSLSVGGRSYRGSELTYGLDGEELTWSEIQQMTDRYWSVEETLHFTVRDSPQALAPGAIATVELTMRMPDAPPTAGTWPSRTVRATGTVGDPGLSRWPLGVCTFSFAGELRSGRSLRSCVEQVGVIGGFEAVEILGAQVVKGYPSPTAQHVDELANIVRGSGLEPVCYDGFLDIGRGIATGGDDADVLKLAAAEMDIAAALGSRFIRLNVPARAALVDSVVSAADNRGLTVLIELHAQTSHDPDVEATLDLMHVIGSPRLGLILDLSCVMRALPGGYTRRILRSDLPHEAAAMIETSWEAGTPLPALRERLAAAGYDRDARSLATRTYRLFRRSRPDWLGNVLPHTSIIHGKFFEVRDGDESAVPYREVLSELVAAQFGGYIMSEYEGHLWTQAPDTFGQLRAHRRMVEAYSNV